MSATYVALQGEDTDDVKHPDPVIAPAAGHPAPVLHVMQAPPRRVHRGWKIGCLSLLGLMVLGAPAHHHLHRPPPGRGRPHAPPGPHGPGGGGRGPMPRPPWGPHGPGGGRRRPMPRPPWGPRPGGDCDYADYAYDYATPDYGASDDPGPVPPLACCGAAARALEAGCQDAFVKVARGVRRGDIAPDDAAAKFLDVARGCEAKLEALIEKCADAFAPRDDDERNDDDERTNSNDEQTDAFLQKSAACKAAITAMSMPCVDEPGGVLRALEANEIDPETAARTLGAAAEECADAAANAETTCAEKQDE